MDYQQPSQSSTYLLSPSISTSLPDQKYQSHSTPHNIDHPKWTKFPIVTHDRRAGLVWGRAFHWFRNQQNCPRGWGGGGRGVLCPLRRKERERPVGCSRVGGWVGRWMRVGEKMGLVMGESVLESMLRGWFRTWVKGYPRGCVEVVCRRVVVPTGSHQRVCH